MAGAQGMYALVGEKHGKLRALRGMHARRQPGEPERGGQRQAVVPLLQLPEWGMDAAAHFLR